MCRSFFGWIYTGSEQKGGSIKCSDNWVVQNLQNALGTWNDKLAEVWQLMTMSPENFKGGGNMERNT